MMPFLETLDTATTDFASAGLTTAQMMNRLAGACLRFAAMSSNYLHAVNSRH